MSSRPFSTDSWNRKATFDFYREFDDPFFQVTAPVEVTRLRAACQDTGDSFFLSSLFHATQAANEILNFRLRIAGQEVREWPVIHAGSTVLNPDHTFSFCYFDYFSSKSRFLEAGAQRLFELRNEPDFSPREETNDLIHFSVLPWIAFTSFKHARRLGREDSIPKIVFGKYEEREGKSWMPVSVEVHHALMDGYQVGLYFEALQQHFLNP